MTVKEIIDLIEGSLCQLNIRISESWINDVEVSDLSSKMEILDWLLKQIKK